MRGGGNDGASPKKPQKSAAESNPYNNADNSDSVRSDNEVELQKKKLTSNQLLHKYVKAMIAD